MPCSKAECYLGEPVFVKGSQAQTEDEGLILSLVLDQHGNSSFLLIFNAQTLVSYISQGNVYSYNLDKDFLLSCNRIRGIIRATAIPPAKKRE